MEMQQLHYFVSVYKSKNLTRSAEECHISAQGISVSIHRLEDELGEKLFVRTSKGLLPTEYADFLFTRAQRILASRDECLDFFYKNKRPDKICRIALAQGTIEEYAGPILQSYCEQFPEVQLDVHESTDKNCTDALLTGTAELALVVGPVDREVFDAVELFNTRYALITPSDSPWAKKESITVQELRSIPIAILDNENSMNSTLMAICSREGFEPDIFCTPRYVLALFALVENRICSGIVTESLARRMANPNISVLPITNAEYIWKISLIKNKNAEISPESAEMWKIMTMKKGQVK